MDRYLLPFSRERHRTRGWYDKGNNNYNGCRCGTESIMRNCLRQNTRVDGSASIQDRRESFRCNKCSFFGSTKESLERHMTDVHVPIKRRCERPPTTTTTTKSLQLGNCLSIPSLSLASRHVREHSRRVILVIFWSRCRLCALQSLWWDVKHHRIVPFPILSICPVYHIILPPSQL